MSRQTVPGAPQIPALYLLSILLEAIRACGIIFFSSLKESSLSFSQIQPSAALAAGAFLWVWDLKARSLMVSAPLSQLLEGSAGFEGLEGFYRLLSEPAAAELEQALNWVCQEAQAQELKLVFKEQAYVLRLEPLWEGPEMRAIQGRMQAQALEPRPSDLQPSHKRLLHQLAHDIRNALSSIGGFGQMLKRRKWVSDEVASVVERMQQAAADAHLLLQEMLFTWEQEFDQAVQQRDLLQMLNETLLWFSIRARTKEIDFRSELPAQLSAIVLPTSWLERLLKQLLDTALNQTPAGGGIQFVLKQQEQSLLFKLQDSGAGISQELQARLFEKFSGRDTAGSTLGLYLARHILEVYQGRIWFESVAEGGSIFYLEVPLQEV